MVSTLSEGHANSERDYVNMSVENDKDVIFDVDADDVVDDENFEFCMVGRSRTGPLLNWRTLNIL